MRDSRARVMATTRKSRDRRQVRVGGPRPVALGEVTRLTASTEPSSLYHKNLLPVTYVVAVLLMGMGALLIYADIVKPVNLFG